MNFEKSNSEVDIIEEDEEQKNEELDTLIDNIRTEASLDTPLNIKRKKIQKSNNFWKKILKKRKKNTNFFCDCLNFYHSVLYANLEIEIAPLPVLILSLLASLFLLNWQISNSPCTSNNNSCWDKTASSSIHSTAWCAICYLLILFICQLPQTRIYRIFATISCPVMMYLSLYLNITSTYSTWKNRTLFNFWLFTLFTVLIYCIYFILKTATLKLLKVKSPKILKKIGAASFAVILIASILYYREAHFTCQSQFDSSYSPFQPYTTISEDSTECKWRKPTQCLSYYSVDSMISSGIAHQTSEPCQSENNQGLEDFKKYIPKQNNNTHSRTVIVFPNFKDLAMGTPTMDDSKGKSLKKKIVSKLRVWSTIDTQIEKGKNEIFLDFSKDLKNPQLSIRLKENRSKTTFKDEKINQKFEKPSILKIVLKETVSRQRFHRQFKRVSSLLNSQKFDHKVNEFTKLFLEPGLSHDYQNSKIPQETAFDNGYVTGLITSECSLGLKQSFCKCSFFRF